MTLLMKKSLLFLATGDMDINSISRHHSFPLTPENLDLLGGSDSKVPVENRPLDTKNAQAHWIPLFEPFFFKKWITRITYLQLGLSEIPALL